MHVAIISDTHIPSRATSIPAPFRDRIADADHVIHAGDFATEGTLANVRDLATDLTAVVGNIDPDLGLPEVVRVELGGVEFVVTHGTGPLQGYERRVAAIVHEAATSDDPLGVAGHTHEVFDGVVDGVRLLNPGSASGAMPADRPTMATAEVADGSLDVTIHEH